MMLGRTFLEVNDATTAELKKMTKEGMKALIMHEVGHTLRIKS